MLSFLKELVNEAGATVTDILYGRGGFTQYSTGLPRFIRSGRVRELVTFPLAALQPLTVHHSKQLLLTFNSVASISPADDV